ncbi:MAG: gamma carbonic anhydrase family protein [Deltaproteobacteria bacterium]|nr:gamma carbonic anhydrase family protein [Deltaproteobacteria bacterium]
MTFYEFEGKRPRVDEKAFIHPRAVLIGDVIVEEVCYIGAGAVLRGDIGSIRIGRGSNVQENCVLHAFPDKVTLLHRDTHIGHGCILHGCEICSNVLVGMGSIIADGAKINSNCLIGAGSFVDFGTEIPAGSVVMGSPARVAKKITKEQLQQLASSRAVYQDLARRHLRAFRAISLQEVMKR